MSLGTIKDMRPDRAIMSMEELEAEAAALVTALSPKSDRATLITLSGELGAGKTAFTQAAARALGVTETVTSPTFVLSKSYPLPEGGAFSTLIHIDAYRLEEGKDLHALDFAQVMKDASTLVMLEWPERVIDGLPHADIAITLTVQPDGSRTISYA